MCTLSIIKILPRRLCWLGILVCLFTLLAAWGQAKPLTPYNQGYDQGRQAGRREGMEVGRDYGQVDGEQDGYEAGVLQAQEAILLQAQLEARRLGQADGAKQGAARGASEGESLGREEGFRDGTAAGQASAKETAFREVEATAKAAGVARAQRANPEADGTKEGRVDGRQRAQDVARKEDYEEARVRHRQAQFEVVPQQKMLQRQGQLSYHQTLYRSHFQIALGRRSRPACDYRYLQYPSDNEEFQKAFRKGYLVGYRDGFDNKYEEYYDLEFRRALRWGANQVRSFNVDKERQAAYDQAYDTAVEVSYREAHAQAKERAYSAAFQQSFSQSYARFYPGYLKSLAQEIEQAAFDSLYRARFEVAFAQASSATYNAVLPEERKKASAEGLRAEKTDFQTRPLRLTKAWITPTDVPNISLLSVKFRNFGEEPIAGHRVTLFAEGEHSRLYHSVPPKSEVTVTGAFRITDPDKWRNKTVAATLKTQSKDYPIEQVQIESQP